MIDVKYKVVFEDDLLPGQEQAVVQEKLAGLFGVDAKLAGQLFSGKQHKVKSNLDLKHAKKYSRALAKLGALAYIEQEMIESDELIELKEPIGQDDTKFTETGSFEVSAVRAFFDEQAAKQAANDKTGDHEIFNLDELDDVVASVREDMEPTGVHNVLDAEQIAKMLNSK